MASDPSSAVPSEMKLLDFNKAGESLLNAIQHERESWGKKDADLLIGPLKDVYARAVANLRSTIGQSKQLPLFEDKIRDRVRKVREAMDSIGREQEVTLEFLLWTAIQTELVRLLHILILLPHNRPMESLKFTDFVDTYGTQYVHQGIDELVRTYVDVQHQVSVFLETVVGEWLDSDTMQ
ncbi:hypothetical protein AAF712_003949 [Marasmius tenuissimus]|uniref:Uncharacterized protein n=1 Tax=Marasmius tenuissimus TaxID=585030 RepID=A0ABR3A6J0_9AGAR